MVNSVVLAQRYPSSVSAERMESDNSQYVRHVSIGGRPLVYYRIIFTRFDITEKRANVWALKRELDNENFVYFNKLHIYVVYFFFCVFCLKVSQRWWWLSKWRSKCTRCNSCTVPYLPRGTAGENHICAQLCLLLCFRWSKYTSSVCLDYF